MKIKEIYIEKVAISEVKLNPDNPRNINKDKFDKLVRSVKTFPEMLKIRPIVVDDNMVILGGNMRLQACKEAGFNEVHIIRASNLTEEQKREFIIKDNVGFGDWDWDILANEWEEQQLDAWGLDIPNKTETERLSELKFEDIYYTPEENPEIDLKDCVDLDKFNSKLKVIEESPLPEEKKELLKFFAYRFIKIDFESVANYYYFNADDEEQKVMERLRLVLCDNGVDGFIADDIIKLHGLIDEWKPNEEFDDE